MNDWGVCVALRRNGRVTLRHMDRDEVQWLLLEPGFLKHPDIQGRVDGGATAPRHDGLLVIDADTHWIGELSHSSFPLTSFNCREVGRSMTAALRIAQTLGELGWEALELGTSEPVPVAWEGRKSEDVWKALDRLCWDEDTIGTASLRPVLPDPWRIQSFWALREQDWLALAMALVERQWIPSDRNISRWEAAQNNFSQRGLRLTQDTLRPFRAVHAAAQLNQTLDNPSTAPTRPRL